MLAFLIMCSCRGPGLVSQLATREARRGKAMSSALEQMTRGEAGRAAKIGAVLGGLPSELARTQRIPAILRTIQREATRSPRGLERVLELWRRDLR